MCGIAGIIGKKANVDATALMINALHHRGPDDNGVEMLWQDNSNKVVFGSSRLSIIDLSPLGHMPMKDKASGNWITYNGEIYNYKALRKELSGLGHSFISETDTEVLLHAYSEWGVKCLNRLTGMFAFAVWDNAKKQIFIARDRIGIKPLYYSRDPQTGFIFASEVRAIMKSGLIKGKLDINGMDSYLCNGFVISPLTIIAGIKSLLPGHYMIIDDNGVIKEQPAYWSFSEKTRNASTDEQVRSDFLKSVSDRLISDVPLCVFLSAGMDSNAILGASNLYHKHVNSVSIGFNEKEFDESQTASTYASAFGCKNSVISVSREMFLSQIDKALEAMDQPTYDGINTYFTSVAAKSSGFTVALSGMGSDELFGGYLFLRDMVKIYRTIQMTGTLKYFFKLTDKPDPFAEMHGIKKITEIFSSKLIRDDPYLAAYQARQIIFPAKARNHLMESFGGLSSNDMGIPPEFLNFILKDRNSSSSSLDIFCLLASRIFLAERCLRDVDSMSMSQSLEVRVPFVDPAFSSTLLSIDSRRRCRNLPNKAYEYEVLKPFFSANYQHIKKRGFIFPFQIWLRSPDTNKKIQQSLSDPDLSKAVGLNTDSLKHFTELFEKSDSPQLWSRMWTLYVIIRWCEINGVNI